MIQQWRFTFARGPTEESDMFIFDMKTENPKGGDIPRSQFIGDYVSCIGIFTVTNKSFQNGPTTSVDQF